MPISAKRQDPPFAAMFPRMDYYEIDSARAGARYAVWVLTPKIYDADPEKRFPAIYYPDGNSLAVRTAGVPELGQYDFMDPFQSTIQVCVGYPPEEAAHSLAIRARDLLPPNEALPERIEEGVKNTAAAGLLDEEGADLYLHHLRNPAADRFLAFLSEELHPFIAETYRIEADTPGLFGHSYGGLFATYAALQPETIFRNIGASSPGIIPGRSQIFALHAAALAAGGVSPRNLFMPVATREITLPGLYQELVGGGTVEFIRLIGQKPIEGISFTSRMIEHETHATVVMPAIHAFLRAFYLREA